MDIYENVKKRKPFAPPDLIVYAAIILLCAGLFGCFFISRNALAADGFKIKFNDGEIFFFYYSDCTYRITEDFGGDISVKTVDADKKLYSVTVRPFGGEEYNLISVDAANKTVKVENANCSDRKDCAHTPAIKDGAGAIYCMPHKLSVLPIKAYYRPISTGGAI